MRLPIKIILAALFVLQSLLLATALAAGVTDGKIIGAWRYSSADGESKRTLEFFADHTCQERAVLANAVAVFKGKWRISNGKVWATGFMDAAIINLTKQAEYESAYELLNDGKLKWARGGQFILYERLP
ncbi:MAG: hypothetical protein ACKN9T_19775 [Candidatus Methylumidiphilus sp.]